MLEVLYHHAKFGGAWISPAAGVAKTLSFLLFICPFVCHIFVKQQYLLHMSSQYGELPPING